MHGALQEMCEPDFWKSQQLWQDDYKYRSQYLAAQAIQSVGIVDSDQSRRIVEILHSHFDLDTAVCVDVADARRRPVCQHGTPHLVVATDDQQPIRSGRRDVPLASVGRHRFPDGL